MLCRIKGLFSRKPRAPKVVTRFAPSPTGFLHIGGVRTALFSFLYARQNNGAFALRIEDTDKERSRAEWTDGLIQDLAWLGLHNDSLVIQSERAPIHRTYLEKLIKSGHAYVSKETPTEPGQRAEVIRFKNPNKVVVINDLIRGEVKVDTTDLGNFVIARSIDEPIYHFAVVADDMDMGVTHVIRAEEHLSNTPRQILIQEALGAPRPIYAHLPLVLAADKSKLSKRKHGETVSLTYYRSLGYLPQAILNFVALLGWNPGTDQEIFTLDELVKAFDLSKVQKGGAVFNDKKLRWVNKEHLKRLPKADFEKELVARLSASERVRDLGWKIDADIISRIAPVVLDRIEVYSDIDAMIVERDLDYYFAEPQYDALSLKWKDETDLSGAQKHLANVRTALQGLKTASWNEEGIKAIIWPYAEQEGRGAVLWPLRYALSGKDRSPNPFTIAAILGKDETIRRIETALDKCAHEEATHEETK
jgi:glutamyl-tRNA synthetase